MGRATLLLSFLIATACASSTTTGNRTASTAGPAVQEDTRTMVIALRTEPKALVGTDLNPAHVGISPDAPWQLFHAGLTQHDEKERPQLQLAEDFPRLNTDSWKVFPDGRMETIWRLRPGLTWHDGAPLVADDFILGTRFSKGTRSDRLPEVEGVEAPDARTLVIHYKVPNPDAGEIDWQPLPRHLIGATLDQMEAREAFETLPYWTTEFVGVGPYRLTGWEPTVFITGEAFEGWVFGKPRIGRVQLVWIPDANTAVADLLSGTVHLATDLAVAFEQGSVLKREWGGRTDSGSVLLSPARTVYVQIQFRPEFQRPATLQDVRLRRALAHGIDKRAIVDAVLDGEPGMADTLVAKEEEYYPELDRVLTKYPLNAQRAEQLLAELRYTKDEEGYYGQGGTRLTVGLTPLGDYLREALILADGWKRVGVDVPLQTLSPVEQTDQRIASVFPALIITQFAINPNPFFSFISATLASEATRWAGRNKGGYYDPEMERLYGVFTTSLDRSERNRAVMQAMQLVADQAAYFPLYYAYEVMAHTGAIQGPKTAKRANSMWKIEEWSWRS